jgi:leucyl aminopeptidase (aminopeptidase T)
MLSDISPAELSELVTRVFAPASSDRALAILVDLPDEVLPDNEAWRVRRRMAATWAVALDEAREMHGLDVSLVLYRNARANNADLPEDAMIWDPRRTLPETMEETAGIVQTSMKTVLTDHQLLLAPTELSATAPLKMLCPVYGCRAATMPGFSPEMVPALRLDYTEVNRRVMILKEYLDRAIGADCVFDVQGMGTFELHLDLRHRCGHASGGMLPQPGMAGNLPSGEAYIVPYEGEIKGDPSSSEGVLPVQLEGEIVLYRIERNKAVEVLSKGPVSRKEAVLISTEPAYANLAELGLGVLAAFGVRPVGEVLLDEKLGLHIAFGRSEHFGGQIGPDQFSSPGAVTHQDRVYIEELQPGVRPARVDLSMEAGERLPLMRNGRYVIDSLES